jgi:hypothetical protein
MRKISYLLAILSMLLSITLTSFAANIPTPTEKYVLIYKCDKAILTCQNPDENIEKGKTEFEQELRKHYENRILIEDIRYDCNETQEPLQAYKDMLKSHQKALIIKINLAGQGSQYIEYQNGFGARIGTYVPTTKIHFQEVLVTPESTKFIGRDYGIKDYFAQTYAMGRQIYSTQTDPRKLVKNGIRGCLRDICKFAGAAINKYSAPDAYKNEVDRFLCKFDNIK